MSEERIEQEVALLSRGDSRAYISIQAGYLISQVQQPGGILPALSEAQDDARLRPRFHRLIREAKQSGWQVEYRGSVLSDGDRPNAIHEMLTRNGGRS